MTKEAPYKGPGADSEEKGEPVSNIDIAVADSLKVLDLKRPIREADMLTASVYFGSGPNRRLIRRNKLKLFDCLVVRFLSQGCRQNGAKYHRAQQLTVSLFRSSYRKLVW